MVYLMTVLWQLRGFLVSKIDPILSSMFQPVSAINILSFSINYIQNIRIITYMYHCQQSWMVTREYVTPIFNLINYESWLI